MELDPQKNVLPKVTNHYQLFRRRSGIFYLKNWATRKQESLRTRDKAAYVNDSP